VKKLSRAEFIRQSLQAGAFVSLGTMEVLHTKASPYQKKFEVKESLLQRMVKANEGAIEKLLATDINELKFSRKIGYDFANLSAGYVSPQSKYYHHAQVVTTLEKVVQFLASFQAADGTVNIGNLESPPDTAFLLESLTAGAFLLMKDDSATISGVSEAIKQFLLKAGEALVIGGVHTPNHRWVICAALARLNKLYPNPKYLARIDDWLGEGIFNDADGHYPERSMNYGYVEDNSLITMARLLNKPALLEPVRKNLQLTWYCTEHNGDLVSNDSRRQDKYQQISIVIFYLHYRYMAIRDNNAMLAGICQFIETLESFEERIVNTALYLVLENETLQKELPQATAPPVNFEKLFTTSSLLRIRRNDTSMTLFGGIDQPLIIASGRSESPNFFAYRKGKAILNYMRLSTRFFSTGYFYSDGLNKVSNSYVLSKKLDVPYYQPLPKNLRNAKGDYKLSPSVDDRFWNKMDFQHRPVSNVKTLQTKVTLTESNGNAALQFDVTGQPGVEVTVELNFRTGGKLSGAAKGEAENYFLEEGMGKYEMGGDVIFFGPGIAKHRNIMGLEGERYSTHFGSLRTEGMHVYLTGITPFRHQLQFS
jgi:hypothetical protein